MTELVEFGIPTLLFASYFLLFKMVLRAFGFQPLNWHMDPERVAPWRRLAKLRFVGIHGVLGYTVPMSLFIFSMQYLDRQSLLKNFGPYHIPPWREFLATGGGLTILLAGGVWTGFSRWRKIWHREYDLP